MGDALRDRLRLSDLPSGKQVIDVKETLADFERLVGTLEQAFSAVAEPPRDWREAAVTGRLELAPSPRDRGRTALSGRVSTQVDCVCQRCLEPMKQAIDVELDALMLGKPPGNDDVEYWELEDDTVRLLDLIDEALVMQFPLSPKHEDAACRATPAGEAPEQQTTRPFADLKSQMEKQET